jgi:hypothetical protein
MRSRKAGERSLKLAVSASKIIKPSMGELRLARYAAPQRGKEVPGQRDFSIAEVPSG